VRTSAHKQVTTDETTQPSWLDADAPRLLQEPIFHCISIHGQSGTGKSLFAAHLASTYLNLDQSVTALLLGKDGQVAQFLNQTMGIGLDLYHHLRSGAFRVLERDPPSFADLMWAVSTMPQSDMILIDHVEYVNDAKATDVERTLAWLLRSTCKALLFTASVDVGAYRDFATIQIDLSHTGRDVQRAYADAVVEIRAGTSSITRSLRVAATGLELWES
jgi:hypothetical protein